MTYLSKKKWNAIKKEMTRLLRREFDEDEIWIENDVERLFISTRLNSFTLDGERMVLRVNDRKGWVIGKMCMMETAGLTASAFARIAADTITLIAASVNDAEENYGV